MRVLLLDGYDPADPDRRTVDEAVEESDVAPSAEEAAETPQEEAAEAAAPAEADGEQPAPPSDEEKERAP